MDKLRLMPPRGKRWWPFAAGMAVAGAAAFFAISAGIFGGPDAAPAPVAPQHGESASGLGPPPQVEDRITWQGSQWYVHGVNLPWLNWGCDIGCGDGGGVRATAIEIEGRVAALAAAGGNTLRWWIFPGDAWQIERGGDAMPVGLADAIYADLDAAIEIARRHDIYLNLVLFSAPSALPRAWIESEQHQAALAGVLAELFARYADEPHVMSWEVINEPEWEMWNGTVDAEGTIGLVTAIADSVHAHSNALVTVGAAMVDGLGFWRDVPLDYQQVHWYDSMASGDWCARCRDAADIRDQYGVEGPIIVGEFYAGPDVDALARYEDFRSLGYAGSWAWSLFPEKTFDQLQIDPVAFETFSGRHSDLRPPVAFEPSAIVVAPALARTSERRYPQGARTRT